jgi:hypothetical protein
LYRRWMYTFDRMEQFLARYLRPDRKMTTEAGRQ